MNKIKRRLEGSCWNSRLRLFVVLLFVSCLTFMAYHQEVNKTFISGTDSIFPLIIHTQENYSVEDVINIRRKRVNDVCARVRSVSKKTTEVSGIMAANLSYCIVQKAGCTMWIRLFKFMEGQNNETGNPMTLTKYMIHNEKMQYYKKFRQTGDDTSFFSHSVRAMTVRNPYTRLWSAFIDKFLLPGFWLTKGKHIIRMIRENPKPLSAKCGHDVTFPEFIQYVITIGHRFTSWNLDKHWLPASDICDPCFFNPHIIGKQESFMEDMKYTLKHVKLDYLLPKIMSIDPTEFEIKDEIDYSFQIFSRVKTCIDIYELCKRIWTAFIFNGYLPSEVAFPTNIDKNSLNIDSFYELVKGVRTKYNITKADVKVKRKHALVAAYKQISEKSMNNLKRLYKMDFELFGYEPEPEFLDE
ncbi:carbohydrate sulfotransferase 11-like isoform X2 [Mercenaria mercenaria]|uniref:carbohydrate sulfotransferase 11-like isoform X2 n=1 Tax=Mercenaria mercenaria TaxID=6596 RepID=UPI001E1D7C80|nr:carbohydrate sulfotransferase 11-like isoform X2 [Mercenaria mercenaria]